jgi:hypothetical protein
MHNMDHEEGRYRVLLIGIGDHTEEKRESFCKNISEIYGISFPLLKKIVDHCPTVLKKNLSFRKAEALAKRLHSFGAVVSVEEKRDSSAVSLEFQEMTPLRVALDSSYLRRTPSGSWNVIGRAKNISEESLNDIWVLIQLFDAFDEFLTFEEVPMPVNPLPPGEASPFKAVFEGDLPIKRVSIAFKNSSGSPLPAVDRRERREWVQVRLEIKEEEEEDFPSSFMPEEDSNGAQSVHGIRPSEEISQPPQAGFPYPSVEETQLKEEKAEEKVVRNNVQLTPKDNPSGMTLGLLEKSFDLPLEILEENETQEKQEVESLPEYELPPMLMPAASEKGEAEEGKANTLDLGSPPITREKIFPETRIDLSIFEEATKLLEEISAKAGEKAKVEPPPFSWIEDFRNSVETYHQNNRDIFSSWFEAQHKKEGFAHPLHSVVTILVHARFNQKNQSEKALENTQRVFKLILQPSLQLEQIPLLEGTPFFSGENWRDLFHRAIPKLQQVANNIIEKKRWNASDLERLIQIIPHMSDRNSRMAIRWIHELIPDVIEIDFSNTPISVGESLYRVGSRLGVVDPHFDYYQGKNSIGDLKIQAFAKAAYPQNPLKIEEPTTWVGMMKEEGGGGYCLPTQPHCEGCLFEAFCPRLYFDFNPSEKGMRRQ